MLFAIIMQTYNKAFIVLDYYANTESFAVQCENKSKPWLHCNGQCQMIKKLKQEDSKDNQNPERRSSQDEVISSKSFFSSIDSPVYFIKASEHFIINDARVIARPRTFFHPPSYSCLI